MATLKSLVISQVILAAASADGEPVFDLRGSHIKDLSTWLEDASLQGGLRCSAAQRSSGSAPIGSNRL